MRAEPPTPGSQTAPTPLMNPKWGGGLDSSTFYLSVGLLQEGHPSRDRDAEKFPNTDGHLQAPGAFPCLSSLPEPTWWCVQAVQSSFVLFIFQPGKRSLSDQSPAVVKEFCVSPHPAAASPQVIVDCLPNRWDKGEANCISPQVTGKAGGKLFRGFPWLVTAWKSQIPCPRRALAKSSVLTISSLP